MALEKVIPSNIGFEGKYIRIIEVVRLNFDIKQAAVNVAVYKDEETRRDPALGGAMAILMFNFDRNCWPFTKEGNTLKEAYDGLKSGKYLGPENFFENAVDC